MDARGGYPKLPTPSSFCVQKERSAGSGGVHAEEGEKPREGREEESRENFLSRAGAGMVTATSMSSRSPFEKSALVFCPTLRKIAAKKEAVYACIYSSFVPIPFPNVADLVQNLFSNCEERF